VTTLLADLSKILVILFKINT